MGDDMEHVQFSDKDFRKSSFSQGYYPYCVEVAAKESVVAVRDSKNPRKSTVRFTKKEWEMFIKGVKAGEFDM